MFKNTIIVQICRVAVQLPESFLLGGVEKKACLRFCYLALTYNGVQQMRRFDLRQIQKAEHFTMIKN